MSKNIFNPSDSETVRVISDGAWMGIDLPLIVDHFLMLQLTMLQPCLLLILTTSITDRKWCSKQPSSGECVPKRYSCSFVSWLFELTYFSELFDAYTLFPGLAPSLRCS